MSDFFLQPLYSTAVDELAEMPRGRTGRVVGSVQLSVEVNRRQKTGRLMDSEFVTRYLWHVIINTLLIVGPALAFLWPQTKDEHGNAVLRNAVVWTLRIFFVLIAFVMFSARAHGYFFAWVIAFPVAAYLRQRRHYLKIMISLAFLCSSIGTYSARNAGVERWNAVAQSVSKKEFAEDLKHEYQRHITLETENEVLSPDAQQQLNSIENHLAENRSGYFQQLQLDALRVAHASYTEKFVNSPGFGAGRMLRPAPYQVRMYVEELPPSELILQPDSQSADYLNRLADDDSKNEPEPANDESSQKTEDAELPDLSSGVQKQIRENLALQGITEQDEDDGGFESFSTIVAKKQAILEKQKQKQTQPKPNMAPKVTHLAKLHTRFQGNFIDPFRFGYVKPQEYAVGFQPHQFQQSPDNPKVGWSITRIELVSLLKQKIPAVYVSEFLPNMEELADKPTRPLTVFETVALTKLKQGEDIVVDNPASPTYMLGSLRAARQCLQCHAVERGVLLGAFSYQLRNDPPRSEPIDKKSL